MVERYRKLETPTANESFDAEVDKETNAWTEANVDASGRETVAQKDRREILRGNT